MGKMTLSLELSKTLWERGVKLETEKWWVDFHQGYGEDHREYNKKLIWELRYKDSSIYFPNRIPAPSTDELVEILPREISIMQLPEGDSFRWDVGYNAYQMKLQKFEYAKNGELPEALAKMVIYLLDNGYHFNPEKKRLERE